MNSSDRSSTGCSSGDSCAANHALATRVGTLAMRTKVWRWKGGKWHFANLPARPSARIRAIFGATARGWGSIRVRLRIGDTEWATSLFPDRKSKTYLFAIKADVRKAESIDEGDTITARLHIV